MWDSKPAIYNSQGTHNSVSQGRWMSCEETKKILIRSYWMELVTGKFQQISRHLYNFQFTLFKQKSVRFKEECPPHRIDCLQGRKPGGSTRVEENPIRDTACRLRGKGLNMPCDSYWGWLSWFYRTPSHFVSFKNRNHWPQFESCLKSSSDRSAICIKLDLVESEKFSAWMKYMRNHLSHVIM